MCIFVPMLLPSISITEPMHAKFMFCPACHFEIMSNLFLEYPKGYNQEMVLQMSDLFGSSGLLTKEPTQSCFVCRTALSLSVYSPPRRRVGHRNFASSYHNSGKPWLRFMEDAILFLGNTLLRKA